MPFWRDSGSPAPARPPRSWSDRETMRRCWRRRRNERLVVTTDAVVEGVHFSRAYSTPADIGHKALAVNLSDLAAMAATPRWALLSLVLPGSRLVADVEDLVDGLAALARRHGVSVVGGNITRTDGPLVVDVTAGGEVAPRRWLTRSGARAGRRDLRQRQRSAAPRRGLEMLATGSGIGDRGSGIRRPCVARHRRPEPRVRFGHRDGPGARGAGGDGLERRAGRCAAAGRRGQRRRRADRCRRAADRSGARASGGRRGASTR